MLVVELFANVIAYALESAAALALGMFRLVKDQRGRKLSRQDGTFGGGGSRAGGSSGLDVGTSSSASMAVRSVSIESSGRLAWPRLNDSERLGTLGETMAF